MRHDWNKQYKTIEEAEKALKDTQEKQSNLYCPVTNQWCISTKCTSYNEGTITKSLQVYPARCECALITGYIQHEE